MLITYNIYIIFLYLYYKEYITKMYIDILRFLAIVVLLLLIAIDNYPYIVIIKNATFQFIVALFCITILLLVDNITGFILILATLVLYFKIYNKLLINNKKDIPYTLYENDPNNNIYESIYEKVNYTTDKNLVDAQNNIVDLENYNSEIKIIENKVKELYSTQGLDVGSVKGYNRDELAIESNLIQ